MNKVKRWRKCWISALNVYRHEYMQSSHSHKTSITHRHKQKFLYLIFNTDMDSRATRVSGFAGPPLYMDEFT